MKRLLLAFCLAGCLFACSAPGTRFPTVNENTSFRFASAGCVVDEKNPFSGFHIIYVNRTAYELAQRGGPYEPGTTWIAVTHDVRTISDGYAPGERRAIAVMEKVEPDEAPKTDGWVYRLFRSRADRLEPVRIADPVAECHACHRQADSTDYVFSHVDF